MQYAKLGAGDYFGTKQNLFPFDFRARLYGFNAAVSHYARNLTEFFIVPTTNKPEERSVKLAAATAMLKFVFFTPVDATDLVSKPSSNSYMIAPSFSVGGNNNNNKVVDDTGLKRDVQFMGSLIQSWHLFGPMSFANLFDEIQDKFPAEDLRAEIEAACCCICDPRGKSLLSTNLCTTLIEASSSVAHFMELCRAESPRFVSLPLA